jgi:hypothetical protein
MDLIKGHIIKKTIKNKFVFIAIAKKIFKNLKEAFIKPLVLSYFNPKRLIMLITNALGFIYTIILL